MDNNFEYYTHTDPLLKQLSLLKVNNMLAIQEYQFLLLFILNKLPIYLQQRQIRNDSMIHCHNACNHKKYSVTVQTIHL